MSPQVIVGEHEVVPAWHGFAGTQEAPAAQGTHAPPMQTLLAPHDVPFWTLPVSRQTGAPVLHTIAPERHGLPATRQAAPLLHATQAPVAPQTRSVPHEAPGATFAPVSLHWTVAPHASTPWWQRLVGVHGSPAVQALHAPAWHTMPAPQLAPSARLSVSVQTAAPVAQTILPTRHRLLVTGQSIPAAHA